MAGRRPRLTTLRLRSRAPVRRGAAPGNRRRRKCERSRACARRRNGLVRRFGTDEWQVCDDSDTGRLLGDAHPPRDDRRHPERRCRGGRRRRDHRPEWNVGGSGALRSSRPADHGTGTGVPRPLGIPPGSRRPVAAGPGAARAPAGARRCRTVGSRTGRTCARCGDGADREPADRGSRRVHSGRRCGSRAAAVGRRRVESGTGAGGSPGGFRSDG